MALGSPLQLQNTVTFGIVSAVARHGTELGITVCIINCDFLLLILCILSYCIVLSSLNIYITGQRTGKISLGIYPD